MRILTRSLAFIDKVSEYTGKAFAFLVVVITIVEVREIVARYVFGQPTQWSWELATILYGLFFIMGGAWVLVNDGHVRTDVFYGRFSNRGRALVDLVLFPCLFFVFVTVLTWYSGKAAINSIAIGEKTYTVWAPPFYPVKVGLAMGFLLLGVQGLAKWIRDLVFVIKGVRV